MDVVGARTIHYMPTVVRQRSSCRLRSAPLSMVVYGNIRAAEDDDYC
jgi:hypothetical protein